MPSQPSLRPFDVAVALRLLLVPEDRYEPLANALATSTSAAVLHALEVFGTDLRMCAARCLTNV